MQIKHKLQICFISISNNEYVDTKIKNTFHLQFLHKKEGNYETDERNLKRAT